MLRAQRVSILLCAAMVGGCAGMDSRGAMNEQCAGNDASLSLSASPALVPRGAPVALVVDWETRVPLAATAATLSAGDGTIVVVVPLLEVAGATWLYRGSLDNPFGALAPPGPVSILAEGRESSCRIEASATTSVTLE